MKQETARCHSGFSFNAMTDLCVNPGAGPYDPKFLNYSESQFPHQLKKISDNTYPIKVL